MADYELVTVWRINAPLEAVWDEISHPQRWPAWWRGLECVTELEPGDEQGVGSWHGYTWKGVLPYRVAFEIQAIRVEASALLEGCVRGGLKGIGRWRLSREDNGTVVRFDWQVSHPRPWMHRIAPPSPSTDQVESR